MIQRNEKTPIMHRTVEHNGVIHFGGVVAGDRSGSMKEQTQQITARLDELLRNAGSDKSQVLSAMLYITDMSKKDEMNEAWTAWINDEDLPARATIGVADLGPDTLIEVVITAAKA
ncbi:RidA family protein [Fodinicurvata fenggangensis]|uniref:RidA family protein n=1 Tax=Fodinicurvata fenggangensis TaxID=1121830 RepID=UPI00047E8B58|nr:RidA family protein [Fodinicurvata fenggangensis]